MLSSILLFIESERLRVRDNSNATLGRPVSRETQIKAQRRTKSRELYNKNKPEKVFSEPKRVRYTILKLIIISLIVLNGKWLISTFDSINPKNSINPKDSINPEKKLPDAFPQKVLKF